MNKIIKFIVSLLAICIVLSIFIDFCRFPECYLETWKYQLQNEIKAGNEEALDYYNEHYIEHGRVLFEQEQPKEEEQQYKSIGDFTLSAYCSCIDCCGKNDGITATGAKVTQGVTVAADPNVIPYGTTIVINGNEYIVQDTLAKHIIRKYDGRIIDVYFDSHSEAFNFGIQTAEVYVKS